MFIRNMPPKKKPLSPHLSIYKPQITSVLSIFHRISGVALFFGLIMLLWAAIILLNSDAPQQTWIWHFFGTIIGKAILMLLSYAIFFHACTGVRHLLWDMGIGFSIKAVYMSGWVAVIISLIFTGLSWTLAYYMMRAGS